MSHHTLRIPTLWTKGILALSILAMHLIAITNTQAESDTVAASTRRLIDDAVKAGALAPEEAAGINTEAELTDRLTNAMNQKVDQVFKMADDIAAKGGSPAPQLEGK